MTTALFQAHEEIEMLDKKLRELQHEYQRKCEQLTKAEFPWQHLNTSPKDKVFLAHSRKWELPRFVKRQENGEYIDVKDGRKVIPMVWISLPVWYQ